MDGLLNQAIALVQFSERQMEGFLIPMNVLVIKICVFIEPQGETQRGPAAGFIHDDLTTLEFPLGRRLQAATSPNRTSFLAVCTLVVGPKDCPSLAKLSGFKKVTGI